MLGATAGFLVAPHTVPSARADSTTGFDVLVDGVAGHVELSTGQYNTGPTNYTLRSKTDQSKVSKTGVSLTQFIRLAGADVSQTNLVQVRRNDGTWVSLHPADFADEANLDFREGPAVFAQDAGRGSFFRPVRDRDDLNAYDNLLAPEGQAMLVRIASQQYLYVDAAADPQAVQVGHSVAFRSVAFGIQEGEHLTYTWHFGDASTAEGREVTHAYDTVGTYKAWVGVKGDLSSHGHSTYLRIDVSLLPPSPTPSVSPSPTVSTSPSPLPVCSTSPSPTGTASPSTSASPSPSPSGTASPAPTCSPGPTSTASPTPSYTYTYSPPPPYTPPPYTPPPTYSPPPVFSPTPGHHHTHTPTPSPVTSPVATGPSPEDVTGFLVAGPGGVPPSVGPVSPAGPTGTSGPSSPTSDSSGSGSGGRIAFAVTGGLLGAAMFGLGVARELPRTPPPPGGPRPPAGSTGPNQAAASSGSSKGRRRRGSGPSKSKGSAS